MYILYILYIIIYASWLSCIVFGRASQSGFFDWKTMGFSTFFQRRQAMGPNNSSVLMDLPLKPQKCHGIYPLVNCYIAIENHHAINGKIHY